MEKIIGCDLYKSIGGKWHKLSECGYLFVECSDVENKFVSLWICK